MSALFALLGATIGAILAWVLAPRGDTPSTQAQAREPTAQLAQNAAAHANAANTKQTASPAASDAQQDTNAALAPIAAAVPQKPAAQTAAAADISATRVAMRSADESAAEAQPEPLGADIETQTSADTGAIQNAQRKTEGPQRLVAVATNPSVPVWQQSRDWMHAQPAGNWVIQLMLSNFSDAAERDAFVSRARGSLGEDVLHQYALQVKGTRKIGVLYGPFISRQAAQQALLTLPSDLRQYQPYMRTLGVVRQEAIYN